MTLSNIGKAAFHSLPTGLGWVNKRMIWNIHGLLEIHFPESPI